MYKNKKILLLFIFEIILTGIFTPTSFSDKPLNKPIRMLPFDYFIIAGWVGPHQTKEQYRLYKEAGFNTVLDYVWEGDDYRKTLELAEKEGLRAILNIDQKFLRENKDRHDILFAKIEKFLTEVKDEKIAYFLYDEPEEENIPLIIETGKLILRNAPEKLTWINFYVQKDFLIARDLLYKFIPSAICMDFYPFEVNRNRMDEYYRYIDWFRKLSLDYNVPFWAFVQSAEWTHRLGDKRLPTKDELRLQVYTNLAYGAKGLWYYTYVTPRHSKSIKTAILDRDDKTTPLYDAVKTINNEVLAIAPILLKLKSVEIVHIDINKKLNPFKPNKIISDIQGDNLLIGYFVHDNGDNYIMLVNKQTDKSQKVSITLGSNFKSIMAIDKQTGVEILLKANNKRYEFEIKSGDGNLLKIL